MLKNLKNSTLTRFKYASSIEKGPLSINAFFVAFLLIFTLFSCKTKPVPAEKMPMTRLEFGHGGGFTGAVTTFILLENGRIYEALHDNKAYKSLRRINKDETTQLFSDCEKLMTLKTDSPGNLYYFVTMRKDSVNSKRWIYGDPSMSTPQELEAMYKRLIGLIPVK
jgi:hypothetical protein